MTDLGVAFWGGMPAADALRCVQTADRRGYAIAYVIESYVSQYPFLAGCAVTTSRIRLATGVTTVYTQSPSMLAMAVATVDELSGGRFTLGIGVGHPEIVATRDSAEGETYSTPLERLKETVDLVQQILAAAHVGGSVDYTGKVFTVRGFAPWARAIRPSVPVHAGTFNRRALEYAGERLDGALPVFLPAADVPAMVEQVRTGAQRVGRDLSAFEYACYIPCCLTDDVSVGRESIRRVIAFHLYAYAHYRRHFARHGLEDVVGRIDEALNRGADEAAVIELVPDDVADSFGLYGPAARIMKGLDRYREAGLTLPVLYLMPPGFRAYAQTVDAGPDLLRAIEQLAPAD